MNRDRSFNFKLLVPPNVTSAPLVSSVRPQEIAEGDFINNSKSQQSDSKTMPFPSASVVTAAKPNRKDSNKMKVAPLQQEENYKPGQLYSTLLDEVEKIKCWKVKVDFEVVQKETKLKENKRIIETQRKAIQELQFGNERLSIKLEEHISENEDLRNKNNATRNLCNILKDTFERSAEKMHLFESEREETHQLFMENSESIQKMIAGFKSLSLQVEADQQEMMKVKEGLLQFEDVKEKYNQEYTLKEEEVAKLQTLLQEKESELKKSLHELQTSQDHCRQLQQTTNEHTEHLKSLKTEQESLLRKLAAAEHHCAETEKNMRAIATKLGETKEEYEQIIQEKDLELQKTVQAKTQLAEKMEQTRSTVQDLQNSLDLKKQQAEQHEDQLIECNKEHEQKNTLLGECLEQIKKQNERIRNLDEELDKRLSGMETLKGKMIVLQGSINDLNTELAVKDREAQHAILQAQSTIAENESLQDSLKAAEKAEEELMLRCKLNEQELQELKGQMCVKIQKSEECARQMKQQSEAHRQLQEKHEALSSNFTKLEAEKKIVEEQFRSGNCTSKAIQEKMKVNEENSLKLKKETQRLEDENKYLREEVNATKAKIQELFENVEIFQKRVEENSHYWHKELTKKEKQIKAMEAKVGSLKRKSEIKFRAHGELQKENIALKNEIEDVTMKSTHLEKLMKEEESKNIEKLNGEMEKLQKELEYKSAFVVELESELQSLRVAAAEAVKSKEETELKCQHKTADMVAVMEKHKNHYVKMVEEKDAELEESRKKELEFESHKRTLVLDTKKQRTEIAQLKNQLVTEMKERENIQKEISNLRKEVSSAKVIQRSNTPNLQAFDFNQKQGRRSEKISSKKRDVYKSIKAPSFSRPDWKTAPLKKTESDTESLRGSCPTTPKYKEFHKETPTSTSSSISRVGGATKVKTYRVRTPPSNEKETGWAKSIVTLDPKSDSSDKTDVLIDPNPPRTYLRRTKINMMKMPQRSPGSLKSPGSSLKLAAMKRMRDAGWTTVTGCDKKKKNSDDIFA